MNGYKTPAYTHTQWKETVWQRLGDRETKRWIESERVHERHRQTESRKDRMIVKESEKDQKRKLARETQRARRETE